MKTIREGRSETIDFSHLICLELVLTGRKELPFPELVTDTHSFRAKLQWQLNTVHS